MTDVYGLGLQAFRETLDREVEGFDGPPRAAGGRSPEDGQWWQANGANMVWAYYQWRMNNPNLGIWHTPDGTPAIELETNITLPDGTLLKAFIDRVMEDKATGELLIVDLKTGKNTPTSPLQLATYRLCIEETFGVSPRKGGFWMARTGTLDAVHDLDRFPPQMVSRWLRDVKKAIDLQLFVPRISKDCGWCGVKQHCYTQNPAIPRPDFLSDLNVTAQ